MTATKLSAEILAAVSNRGGMFGHFAHCETKQGMGRPCTCGWDRIRAMIAKYKRRNDGNKMATTL